MASITPLQLFLPLLLLLLLLLAFLANADPTNVVMNAIDDCWRRDPDWADHRARLARCAVGFSGKMKKNGGRNVTFYQVTDSSDDPVQPRTGTLRYGATLIPGKVWLTFASDMQIKLHAPLLVSNSTTIDGRGADVHISYGAGFLIYKATNVIIHGLKFHHIVEQESSRAVGPEGKMNNLSGSIDGDAIRIITGRKIWIDHNTLYRCYDGLVDVTLGSTRVTISNNRFHDHDKVILLGHEDGYVQDKSMRVTVAFNHFGPNCKQRMPRIRHGYAHIVNNVYDGWFKYAVGGGMDPTIMSQANLYIAPPDNKAIIWENSGMSWNLKSVDDVFINGAMFKELGISSVIPHYGPWQKFPVSDKNDVQLVTRDAGALNCQIGSLC